MATGVTVELQPWITLKGTSGTAGVIQELDEWIDTSAHKSGVLQAEILKIANGTLYVEGCDVQGGSFTTHASYTTGLSAATLVYLNKNIPYGAAERLSNLIRWKFISSGNWDASFRLTLVLK
jgi:hypothetical protein